MAVISSLVPSEVTNLKHPRLAKVQEVHRGKEDQFPQSFSSFPTGIAMCIG